jgi:hypothetical protein
MDPGADPGGQETPGFGTTVDLHYSPTKIKSNEEVKKQ